MPHNLLLPLHAQNNYLTLEKTCGNGTHLRQLRIHSGPQFVRPFQLSLLLRLRSTCSPFC